MSEFSLIPSSGAITKITLSEFYFYYYLHQV